MIQWPLMCIEKQFATLSRSGEPVFQGDRVKIGSHGLSGILL
jgi:hypothetical protein